MRNFLLFRFGSRRYSFINFDKERLEEGATYYVLVKVKLSASRQTYPSAVPEVSGFCDPRTLTLTSSLHSLRHTLALLMSIDMLDD